MYPWISRTLDLWLQFCEKKCGLYMDVYGTCNCTRMLTNDLFDSFRLLVRYVKKSCLKSKIFCQILQPR